MPLRCFGPQQTLVTSSIQIEQNEQNVCLWPHLIIISPVSHLPLLHCSVWGGKKLALLLTVNALSSCTFRLMQPIECQIAGVDERVILAWLGIACSAIGFT